MENLSKCRECKLEKPKIFSGITSDKRKKFVDSFGSMWSRNQCPDCRKSYLTRNDRKYGHKSRFEHVNNSMAKGVKSEQIAAQFLLEIGFKNIRQTNMLGPDLIFDSPDGNTYTAEVKSVVHSTRMKFVNPVSKNRLSDDYFIAVDSDRVVIFEPMKQHLSKCNKTGQRHVTREARVTCNG